MVDALKLIFFIIGTVAFFGNVILAIQHPELVDSTGQEEPESTHTKLRKWDTAIYWVMWAGWGCTALVYYLDGTGYLDAFDQ